MTWVLIILSIPVLIVLYLFIAPFYLEINTYTGLCRVRFHRLGSVEVGWVKNGPVIDLRVAWWRKRINFLSPGEKQEKPVVKKKPRKPEKPGKKKGVSLKTVTGVLKSFRVKRFYLTLGPEEMPVSGVLYPVFNWITRMTGKRFEINFQGENELILELENSCFRMVRAYLQTIIHTKTQNHERHE